MYVAVNRPGPVRDLFDAKLSSRQIIAFTIRSETCGMIKMQEIEAKKSSKTYLKLLINEI